MATFTPTQRHVLRLYRRALKTTFDWYPVMSVFREKQFIMRQLFEQNKHVTSPQQQQLLIEQAEQLLVKYRFHIPYANVHTPEGTKWERNLPPPARIVEKGFGNYKNKDPLAPADHDHGHH